MDLRDVATQAIADVGEMIAGMCNAEVQVTQAEGVSCHIAIKGSCGCPCLDEYKEEMRGLVQRAVPEIQQIIFEETDYAG